jgi:hypothetical protein
MAFLRMSGLALAAVLGLSLPIGQATAMPANGWLLRSNKCPSASKMCAWCAGLTAVGRPAGAGTGLLLIGAGVDRSTLTPDPVGAGADPSTPMPDPVGAGVDHFTLTPDPAGAGADHFTHTPDQVGAGVDRFTLTPDPVGVGAGHSTHLPDPVGVGVGRSMPMPEDPIGAGVDHFTQPQSRPVSASIPGTVVGIPDTPVAARTTPMPA